MAEGLNDTELINQNTFNLVTSFMENFHSQKHMCIYFGAMLY